jgi:hypothetical protein
MNTTPIAIAISVVNFLDKENGININGDNLQVGNRKLIYLIKSQNRYK